MAARKSKGKPAHSRNVATVSPQTTAGTAMPYFLYSGYEAANDSPNRGYVYWPTDDTRRALDDLSLSEIRRRIHWLYGNFGVARRLINGSTKLVGTLTPQPMTTDAAWNKEAFNNFYNRAGSEELFDLAGRFDFWGAQRQVTRSRFKDGDHLTALTKTAAGGAQRAFYEGHQIRSGSIRGRRQSLEERETMAVISDRFGRHTGYRVMDGLEPGKITTLNARDCIYHAAVESHGQVRGLPPLTHAVCNFIDVVEVRGFTKVGLKSTARLGTVIERDLGSVQQGAPGFGQPTVITTNEPDGTGGTQAVNWELVYAGGQVPRMAPGEHVRTVADARPHANAQDFERSLIHDGVLGWDLPVEALLSIAGVTGPGIRFVLNEIARWVANEQALLARWCHRNYTYHIAAEIKSGRLREPSDKRWYERSKVLWIGQPDMTIDPSREGQLAIVRLSAGLTTMSDEWAQEGAYWEDKVDQRVKEVAYAKQRCEESGLELKDVFPTLHPPEPNPVDPNADPDEAPAQNDTSRKR
jgi:capsid protein